MIYNTIHHDIRNAAGLSLLDYCLLESIYLLSNSPNAKYKSWCNAPKEYFTYLTGERNLRKRYTALLEAGWIEFKDDKRMLKRTTKKYYDKVYSYVIGAKKLGEEQSSKTGGNKVPTGGNKVPNREEQNSPNNNINNNKDNSIPTPPQKSNLKLYEMTLQTFTTPATWDADTSAAFHLWCDNMHTIRKGRWGGLSHITELVRLINQQIKTYGNKKTAAAMRAAAVKGGHSFDAKWEQEKEQKQSIKPGQSGQAIKYSFNRKTTNF